MISKNSQGKDIHHRVNRPTDWITWLWETSFWDAWKQAR